MFPDLPLSRFASKIVEDFERHVFLDGVFATRGAMAATARCYSELFGGGSPQDWAETFRDYRCGKRSPRDANKVWQFSTALRLATNQSWCAGPVVLFILFKLTDLIAVLRTWRSLFDGDAYDLLVALPIAARVLPSDYNPELASLYEFTSDEILEDRRLRSKIGCYVKEGIITSFAADRAAYVERSVARDTWTLSREAEARFDQAWSRLMTVRDSEALVDGFRAPGPDEAGLAYAYAIAGVPWAHGQRALVVRSLLDWCRTSTRPDDDGPTTMCQPARLTGS
jgi:hypothetical protein